MTGFFVQEINLRKNLDINVIETIVGTGIFVRFQ
jgi:hypothetical protein